MKLITLWEPWATLMAIGAKKIETRHWGTNYRGWLAIHAAKRYTLDEKLITWKGPFSSALSGAGIHTNREGYSFHLGCIIAVAELKDCLSTVYQPPRGRAVFEVFPELGTDQERAFGNYDPGRYGLVTQNVFKLAQPIPFKSRQGKLLDVPEEIVDEIQRQARASEAPFSCPA